jgi:hypothetical protein
VTGANCEPPQNVADRKDLREWGKQGEPRLGRRREA